MIRAGQWCRVTPHESAVTLVVALAALWITPRLWSRYQELPTT